MPQNLAVCDFFEVHWISENNYVHRMNFTVLNFCDLHIMSLTFALYVVACMYVCVCVCT